MSEFIYRIVHSCQRTATDTSTVFNPDNNRDTQRLSDSWYDLLTVHNYT